MTVKISSVVARIYSKVGMKGKVNEKVGMNVASKGKQICT